MATNLTWFHCIFLLPWSFTFNGSPKVAQLPAVRKFPGCGTGRRHLGRPWRTHWGKETKVRCIDSRWLEFTRQSAREMRPAQKGRVLEDCRAALVCVQLMLISSCMAKREPLTGSDGTVLGTKPELCRHPDWKISCLIGVAGTILRIILPHVWGISSPSWLVASVLPAKP